MSGPTLTLVPDYRSTPESVVDLRGATRQHGAVHISSSLRWDEILIVAGRNEHVAKRPAPPPVLQSIPVTGAVSALAMGDLDSDGFMDFAAADFVDGRVYIYVGDACAQFRRAGSVRVGAGPARLLLEDLDGDGNVDIATANLLDMTISTAMGLGGARFGGALTRAASRELAASPIFELRASAAVDYTAIKSAAATTRMGEGLRRGRHEDNTVTGGAVDTAGRPVGVFVASTAGTADFGTLASPGGDSFTSLLDATHAATNLRNNKATTVDAVGNTWLNPIPTVVIGTTPGFDIQTNPGTVNY